MFIAPALRFESKRGHHNEHLLRSMLLAARLICWMTSVSVELLSFKYRRIRRCPKDCRSDDTTWRSRFADMNRMVGFLSRLTLVCAAFASMQAAMVQAASISVADGDSFRMNGQRYRLQDIDAPELHQNCKDGAGREWPCGRRSRDELRKILTRDRVDCRPVTRDRFGRFVAVCRAGGRDVGELMVRHGWATAYKGRGFTSSYISAENEARAAKRGLWAGSFETPRHWRQGHPRDDEPRSTVLSPAAQDWVRQKTDAVSRWFRSIWTKPNP